MTRQTKVKPVKWWAIVMDGEIRHVDPQEGFIRYVAGFQLKAKITPVLISPIERSKPCRAKKKSR